ncbi:MAG TPA: FAD-dependent oxidoreductase [Candidatus Kapabacteria bacterium]|jgi:ferredoxin-NADP reductase|nr:FAD-dependent oxidoreductase [Candidatus Kapabacteria bacterium]
MPYNVSLIRKYEVAQGTLAFEFEKPADYQFTAGQATDWTLIDPAETDTEGNSRSFSIAAAPEEAVVRIATRMRDTAFKRCLGKMEPGDKLQMDDPWNEFVLESGDAREAVMLCGGIGVTPFYSMLKHAVLARESRKLILFFSNKTVKDAPFREELLTMATQNDAIRIIETLNEASDDWSGERGFIDRAMIGRHVKDVTNSVFYIAGPPQMVAAMKAMLLESGVSEANVKVDDFLGY